MAIEEARRLGKALFVYIYYADHPLCARAEELFHEDQVADAIASGYVFYPLPITTAEGYSLATGMRFRSLPLILLVQPTGQTIAESTICTTIQAEVDQVSLLSFLGVAEHASPDSAPAAEEHGGAAEG
jgi:hypothetical protein